jgi:aspartate kinase
MARIVQKFGGTSVADVNKIRKAAEIVVKAASEGHEVTTVVSAMGHTTDHLISLAEQIIPHRVSAIPVRWTCYSPLVSKSQSP